MNQTIRPRHDRILVRLEPEHQTDSGIVFPAATRDGHTESQRQYGHRGTVLAVGPGKLTKRGVRIAPTVQIGDVVRFGEFMWPGLGGDKTLVMIQEADITGVEHVGHA